MTENSLLTGKSLVASVVSSFTREGGQLPILLIMVENRKLVVREARKDGRLRIDFPGSPPILKEFNREVPIEEVKKYLKSIGCILSEGGE